MLTEESFLNRFRKSKVDKQGLFIVAVSGGPDSMCLLHLMVRNKLNMVVAHVNYQLRGADSDADAALVSDFCSQYQLPFEYLLAGEKLQHMHDSTQSAARTIRYNWFEQLKQTYNAAYILTAHHQSDQAETVLLNLSRGSGIRGMRGISEKNKTVFRPLLSFRKTDIDLYNKEHQVPFRLDVSNNSDTYNRNYIRHHILPALTAVNEQATEHIVTFAQRATFYTSVLDAEIQRIRTQIETRNKSDIVLDLSFLATYAHFELYLYELIAPYGFSNVQAALLAALIPASGKQFFSETHALTTQQFLLFITPLPSDKKQPISYQIQTFPFSVYTQNQEIILEIISRNQIEDIQAENTLYVSLDTLSEGPLTVSTWKPGDRFRPYGFSGHKNISDYLNEKKVPLHKKPNILTLSHNETILAVIPFTIDAAFGVKEDTKLVLRIVVV